MQNELWFKKKNYGWGWTPANWKGWTVTAVYALVMIGYPFLARFGWYTFSDYVFWILLAVSTSIFIFVAYKKGETPEWRWGKKN